MKTKPFNLEEALNGAKVVTREGREVKQLTFFEDVKVFPLAGNAGDSLITVWNIDGTFMQNGDKSENDLFIAVETKSVWANIYIGNNDYPYVGEYFGTEEDAKKFSSKMPNYIKTIEITNQP